MTVTRIGSFLLPITLEFSVAILSFTYHDHVTGWDLQEVNFQQFNLLVGLSSAGKTRILSALRSVCLFGRGVRRRALDGSSGGGIVHASWTLKLNVADVRYEWSVEVKTDMGGELSEGGGEDGAESSVLRVFSERLANMSTNAAVVDRSLNTFLFDGKEIPLLNREVSALNLIETDESIRAIRGALQRVKMSESVQSDDTFDMFPFSVLRYAGKRVKEAVEFQTIDKLKEYGRANMIAKAAVLQVMFPEEFLRVQDEFIEMFPNVKGVKIGHPKEFGRSGQVFDDENMLMVGIQENCMKGWAVGEEISSGMLRTLLHLFELSLLPSDSVVIKDQYEDGLGVNCLAVLTKKMRENAGNVQFILTSHHPYVINNIPRTDWKIVTRIGAQVCVVDASDVPALSSESALPAFSLLVSSDWF